MTIKQRLRDRFFLITLGLIIPLYVAIAVIGGVSVYSESYKPLLRMGELFSTQQPVFTESVEPALIKPVPVVLPVYAILSGLPDSRGAMLIWWAVVVSFCIALILLALIASEQNRSRRWRMIAFFTASGAPFMLYLLSEGSIMPVLLLLFSATLFSFCTWRKVTAGILLGILFLLEPKSSILLIPLLLCHRWRSLIPFLVIAVTGWILFIPFAGGAVDAGTLLLDWYATMAEQGFTDGEYCSLTSILQWLDIYSLPRLVIFTFITFWLVVNPIWLRYRTAGDTRVLVVRIMVALWAVIPLVSSDGGPLFTHLLPLSCLTVSSSNGSKMSRSYRCVLFLSTMIALSFSFRSVLLPLLSILQLALFVTTREELYES